MKLQDTEQVTCTDSIQSFQLAEDYLSAGKDEAAQPLYREAVAVPEVAPLAHFRLAEIANRAGQLDEAFRHHQQAFELDSSLAQRITPQDHQHHYYDFQDVDQTIQEKCPLCRQRGQRKWVYNLVTNVDYNPNYHPVRTWYYCRDCDHIYAGNYPADLTTALDNFSDGQYDRPNPLLLPQLAEIMIRLQARAPGDILLDVGLGAGELSAVALEYGFNVVGLDVRAEYAQQAASRLDIEVAVDDYLQFDPVRCFDVICMGDVLEHMPDPVTAIRKTHTLLNEGGVFWISTPNFASAYSLITGDRDPMRRVCEHLNYFSRRSLTQVLTIYGFEVVDYRTSAHYNGSMEITAVRK
ncbi:MAG: methyltransferase domain-containing protein [bacterium]